MSSGARPAVVFGTGFIGSAVARALAGAGRSVTSVGRARVARGAGRATVVGGLVAPGCDVVFAAGPSVPADVEADPRRGADALDLLAAVIDAVGAAPDATLQFVSSGGAVYGEPDRLPIDETHPLRPRSAYGAALVAGEALVTDAAARGLSATCVRCANAYGPGQDAARGQGLVARLLDAAARGRTVEIWGDGSVERDYVHVDDVAAVVAAVAGRADLPPAVNVGSGEATSVRALIDIVARVTGRGLAVSYRPARAFDVSRVALDVTLLRSLVPFEPTPLDDGVRSTWAARSRLAAV